MLGEHLGQCGLTATDISCYNDVHGLRSMKGCFTICEDMLFSSLDKTALHKVINNPGTTKIFPPKNA